MYNSPRAKVKYALGAPGQLVYVGPERTDEIKITLVEYDAEGHFEEHETADLEQLAHAIETASITWINVIGLHQLNVMDGIGQAFNIHPLLLEDILNTNQRPKIDQNDSSLYIIMKAVFWQEETASPDVEQVSLVIGPNYVLSFLERPNDLFQSVRQRMRETNSRIRTLGADHLAYILLDTIVAHYFLALEQLGDQLDSIEDQLITRPDTVTAQTIHKLKREMIYLRKSIWPLREIIGSLQHGEYVQFEESTLIYLRDVYEHVIQVIDTIETFRDIASGMLDIYLTSASNKMNEVMKVLTVIATIFIPLTFITSLYGMNFAYMPELQWRWGYPVTWLIMLVVSLTMIFYFKKKRWI
jgi:magnesium transporter